MVISPRGPSILFQVPWASIDTPSAVNIWAKNMMKAFMQAGFTGGIHYFRSKNSSSNSETGGIQAIYSGYVTASILRIPKIRTLALRHLKILALSKYSKSFDIIANVEGPFTVKDDRRRVNAVHSGGAKYLHAILEHPAVMRKEKVSDSSYSNYMSSVANIYDVVMPITTCLENEYRKYGRTKPMLLNPIVVDSGIRVMFPESGRRKVRTFAYSGNICHTEEILTLLQSFAIVSKHVSDCRLIVIGGEVNRRRNDTLMQLYKSESKRLGIHSNVTYTGRIPHPDVLCKYKEADAFLLPRPFQLYSQAGFPTKLGEYLITGRPVVTTSTGDIPLYLEDKESAYLDNDGSPGSFAEKVIECIVDKDSSKVGIEGRQIAVDSFSIEAAAERIRQFTQINNIEWTK